MCDVCVCVYTRSSCSYYIDLCMCDVCVCVYVHAHVVYIHHRSPYPANPQHPQELPNWQPIMDRIRRGEQRIARNKEIRALLDEKVSPHKNPWLTLKINYGPQVRASRVGVGVWV